MRVSVLTPTYNRSDKLIRLYNSLEKSTYRDFEWIIVNDGSTDDTDQIIKEIVAMASFPITYIYQENSGKHIAMNRLYDLAKGEYCFQIDDDDELLPDAMEKGLSIWDGMSDEQRSNCWCVCGRHINHKTLEMIGKPFPDNVNEVNPRTRSKILSTIQGDRCGMQKVAFVRQYKFPEVEGCSFFPEIYLWRQLNLVYDQHYTNALFGLCHVHDGESLMNYSKSKESYRNRKNIYGYLLSSNCQCKSRFFSQRHLIEILNYNWFCYKSGTKAKEKYKNISLNNCILLFISFFPSIVISKVIKR